MKTTASRKPGTDAMSSYSHAVVIKSDRVDYSVTKGGFRLWTTLLLFFLLVGGLAHFLSDTEELSKLADALDVDEDGDHDNVDDDDHDIHVHDSKADKHDTDARDKARVPRQGDGNLKDNDRKKEQSSTDGEADDEDEGDEQQQINKDWEQETDADRHGDISKPSQDKDAQTKKTKDQSNKDAKTSKQESADIANKIDADDDDDDEDDDDIDDEESMLAKIGKHHADEDSETPPVDDATTRAPVMPKYQRVKGKLPPVHKDKPAHEDDDLKTDEVSQSADDAGKPKIRPAKRKDRKKDEGDKSSTDDDGGSRKGKEIPKTPRFERRKGKKPVQASSQPHVDADHEKDVEDDDSDFISKPKYEQKRNKRQSKEGMRSGKRRTPPNQDTDNFVPDPNAPLRFFHKHGVLKKLKTDEHEDEEINKDDAKDQSSGLKQTVIRWFRAHGSAPKKESSAKKHHADDADSHESDVSSKTPKKPVRYYRTKGKKESDDACTKEHCKDHVSGRQGSDGFEDPAAGGRSAPGTHRPVTELVPLKVTYRKAGITNRDDNKIRHLLDEADRLLDENRLDEAHTKFQKLADTYKRSPRAFYGLAKTLEKLSDKRQSNQMLEECIGMYQHVLSQPYVPDDLYLLTVERLVDRARFRGWMDKAAEAQGMLVERFPDREELRNGLGVTFLMMGRNDDAKKVFADVLQTSPGNGFAQAHYGYILKTVDHELEEGVKHMKDGVMSGQEGTQDGRFFFHLGDALQRLGRREEAYEIFELAADKGIFLSMYQRSLHNVPDLTAKPWWSVKETGYAEQLTDLERSWRVIRDEGTQLLKTKAESFLPEPERLTDSGQWTQFVLFEKGIKHQQNCHHAQKTCELLSTFPEATLCTRGQVKFSVMKAGTKTFPHCESSNCHLTGHLGLIVPAEPKIRVANETRAWRTGKFIIFDGSFEHEEWHNGHGIRMVLSVDFWHPELTEEQRNSLEPI